MGEPVSALSLDELARRIGESPDRVLGWRSRGLIGREDGEGFDAEDLERARLIQFCVRRGVDVETIVRAERTEKGFFRRYIAQLFPAGVVTISLDEVSVAVGMDVDLVRRLRDIAGSAWPAEAILAQDVEILRCWKAALAAGFPEEALFELVRVYADALGRVAEAETRLFHFYVHERLKNAGLAGPALDETTEAASASMRELIEPALLYFHRQGMAAALREDMLLHLAEYSGGTRSEAPAQLRLAIVFLDLASFTPLTESMGDLAAAEVVARFSELVREIVARRHGRVVERIGDAFMLTFSDAQAAVSCALEIEGRVAQEARFPAVRGGIHVGTVLYREGGYVGANVNLASRVANQARRHQLLVTAEVRAEAGALPDVEFVPLGRRGLKGLSDEIELFEARARAVAQPDPRVVDPVCGMELTPAGVAARLSLEGADLSFCSESCLRKLVESRSR